MGMIKISKKNPGGGRIDYAKVDATTDEEIDRQITQDTDHDSLQTTATQIRQIRKTLSMTQKDFSKRICVPLSTLRNWEQAKRMPAGSARALFKILLRHPEVISYLED